MAMGDGEEKESGGGGGGCSSQEGGGDCNLKWREKLGLGFFWILGFFWVCIFLVPLFCLKPPLFIEFFLAKIPKMTLSLRTFFNLVLGFRFVRFDLQLTVKLSICLILPLYQDILDFCHFLIFFCFFRNIKISGSKIG